MHIPLPALALQVLSRVLTVAGPDGRGHKLLIPFLDLFNHARGAAHLLTGRSDGLLRVVAGAPIAEGEQAPLAEEQGGP